MKLKPSYLLLLAFFVVMLFSVSPGRSRAGAGPDAALPAPGFIACQGWERTTVVVSWDDKATDETNYHVERSIDGGTWNDIATQTPDASGNYAGYRDIGIDTSKNYRYQVRAYRSGDNSYSPYSDICNNRRIYDPGSFRIFYGLLGTTDDCPLINGREVCLTNTSSGGLNVFVNQEYNSLQGSTDAFFRLGYTRRADQPEGGLDKIPINVVWCDGGGCAGGGGLGLAPALIETPFNLTTRSGDPVSYLVALHEAYHFQQFKYWGLNDPSDGWVVEGQARSIQDKICLGGTRSTALCFDDIATGSYGYVPEVKAFLSNPNRPILEVSYSAALFWTYLTEKFGTENMSDNAEMGMDFMRRFWEESAAHTGQTGIGVINSVLASLGRTERFRGIWKDFAVASYAKDYSGPAKYKYADVAQTGGTYGPPNLSADKSLALNESWIATGESVYNWAAKYYEFRPDSNVPFISIKVNQDTTNNLYYTVLGIQGTNIAYEYNSEARNLNLPLLNDSYDKVVIIVVGLENLGNYRISINGTQPTLRILSPTSSTQARVDSQTAPKKFIAQLEVVDGDGLPMVGINMDNFTFRVGTVDVDASSIYNKYQLMGQEWFVIHAPAQSANDPDGTPYTYALEAAYGTSLTDTEDDAIDYTPRKNADSMIILDRSGSMGDYSKLVNAGNAAKLFIDSWQTNDSFGLVTFNEVTTLNMGLTAWSDSPGDSRETAFGIIDALTAGGNTRLGDSLVAGYDELAAHGNSTHDWSLVLLSDGLETDAGTRTFDQAIDYIRDLTSKRPVIHSIAVGPDADRPRMQRAASDTGGTYQYVSAPAKLVTTDGVQDLSSMLLSMDYRYRIIATEVIGYQQFFTAVGPTNPGQDVQYIPVEPGADELVLSLSWDGYMGDVFLLDPYENQYTPFETSTYHMVWRVPTPVGGTWYLIVNQFIIPKGAQPDASAPNDLPPYLVQASLKSDVLMDARITTPVDERVPGGPIHFIASLTDNAPITGASVLAYIETPSGGFFFRWMLDDGLHDDAAANDGVYGGTFYQTGEQGSYNITIIASGYSSLIGGNFNRSAVLSFHIAYVDANGDEIFYGDNDGDGLPDAWEITFYGDPLLWGPWDDPDNDGATNQDEYNNGTNPLDPDTDDDNQADGTDPNPTDPDPATVTPPWAHAYPGNGQVFVKFSIDPSYAFVGLFRNDETNSQYFFDQQQVAPLGGVFTDTGLTDDVQYCYIVAAIDNLNQRSTFSAPNCVTPKVDPLAPHGSVVINGGSPTTANPAVTLTLWASDDVDPETVYTDTLRFLPPADSASGVTDMLISNNPDFGGASWEPYNTSKPWTLGQTSGLAAVYVKYRDAAGNETDTYVATIYIGLGPTYQSFFIPTVFK